MNKAIEILRTTLALVGVLALGYWLGSDRAVKAASSDVAFQLVDVKETSSLLVYQPATRSVYVYRGATAGNAALQCSFKYVLDTPGGAIERVACPVQSVSPR